MKPIIHILIIAFFCFSCTNSESSFKNLEKVELGMTVESVIKMLNTNTSDIHIIQEPPLIYRGIRATLNDTVEIGISFERTPANQDDISKEKGLEIVKPLKITGFVWKTTNGESTLIGDKPKFWNY